MKNTWRAWGSIGSLVAAAATGTLAGCGVDDGATPGPARTESALTAPESLALVASQDTTVSLGAPNQNFGADPVLDVNRALVQFDATGLRAAVGPQDLVIGAQLELTLTASKLRAMPREVSAFRLTRAWSETGATWNCPVDTNPGNRKADCVSPWAMGPPGSNPWVSPATSVVTVPAATTGAVTFDVITDVRAFLSGAAANNGWMLRGSTPDEFAEFSSRESAKPPRLLLTIRRCSASLCNDNNACTTDACDATAACTHTPVANGTTCSDGNACTQSDTCQAGACAGANPVVCTAQDQCHQAGACDSGSGVCSNPTQPPGTSCGGSNVCDASGACVQCLAASSCPGTDSICGTRTCTAGACGMSFAPSGTACGTGLACNGSGACVGVPHVVINEIESNLGSPGDWVELYNAGTGTADVSGWRFLDSDNTHTAYVIPAGTTVAPGAYLVLEEAQFIFGLGAGDSARLFDPAGALVDTYVWTAHAATTYGRCPNGTGDFRTTTTVTKGAANDCSVAIKINEVESNGGSPGDWVEIYNAGPITTDVSGWKFLDNDNTHVAYVVPAGTTVAPGAYLVLEEAQFIFGLGAADSTRLFDAAGTLVDTYSWTAHATTTYGRCPNGTGAFRATTTVTKGAANDCSIAIKLNEIESNLGSPGDWVEIYNAGAVATDVSGWKFLDADDTHTPYVIPAGTSVAPGAYLVLEEAQFIFGLGAGDSARLFDASGALVDSYVWTAHATTTYGRCPNGAGPFTTTTSSTKGASNDCGVVTGPPPPSPWPGANAVVTVDGVSTFGGNLSDLFYQAASGPSPSVLWAVRNGPSTLFRLVWNGTIWTPEAGNGWDAGKTLLYPGGLGAPDTEGVTRAELSSSAMYIATERDNNSGVSRLSILRFDTAQPGAALTATHEWNLNGDIPPVGPNLGLEAITWVPDSYLTANSFFDEVASHTYNPAEYPDHGTGLFFVGIEATGTIYAYALNHVMGDFHRVASFSSGNPGVMSVYFDRDVGYLWAHCDDTCGNVAGIFSVDTTAGATFGKFKLLRQLARPSSMANLNNEGIAIAPESECVAGFKGYYWTDDSETGGHSIRFDSIPCGHFVP